MADFRVTTTSTPKDNDLNNFIELLSTANQFNPLTTAFITEIDGVSASSKSEALPPSRVKQHFSLGLPAAFKSNILLTTATSTSSKLPLAAALFEPPDFSGTPPAQARRQPGPILSQYRAAARALKAKHLAMPDTGPHQWDTPAAPSQASSGPSGDPYPTQFNKDVETEVRAFYHLSLLVWNTSANETDAQKASKAVILPYLERAKKEDVPIFLEAGSSDRKTLFESFGFQVVDEVTIGAGKVDVDGWPKTNGEGVKVWGMIFNP